MPHLDDPRFPGPRVEPSKYWAEIRHAAVVNDPSLIKKNVELGCDVNEQVRGGDTALLTACFNGAAETVNALLEAKADPNLSTGKGNLCYDQTPFMQASYWGCSTEICQMLLDAGANPLHKDVQGKTAWDYVVGLEHKEKKHNMCNWFQSKGLEGEPYAATVGQHKPAEWP